MKPATHAKRSFENTQLLFVHSAGIENSRVGDLSHILNSGDLLLINQSGTLPSRFHGMIERTGTPVEIRLAAFQGNSSRELSRWRAVSFAAGDWRTPTENRGNAPLLKMDDRIHFSDNLSLLVRRIDSQFSRLLDIEFISNDLVKALYDEGKPIQYSYLQEELKVWDQQTVFAGPPISVEPPSASFPFNWDLLLRLRTKGVRVAALLHGAGLSSTGSTELDSKLPLSEYYEISQSTLHAIQEAKISGRKIVALGTTVTRAVESAFQNDTIVPRGYTQLKLGPETGIKVVTSLITGMHESGSSHLELMKAFCPSDHIAKSQVVAETLGYRSHEYGDLMLLQCNCTNAPAESAEPCTRPA